VLVRFSINTNNIAILNSGFSALAAASYGLVSFDGVGLAFRVDGLAHGRPAIPLPGSSSRKRLHR
jgi:hypothetical protein